MQTKHTRRISSLFSLGSTSSDKSVDTANSSPSLAPPTFSDEPSAAIFSEPVSTELHTSASSDVQPSSQGPSLQTPQDDPSEAPPVPAENRLSPIPQMILPLPEIPGPQTGNRLRSKSESKGGIQAESGDQSDGDSRVEIQGGSRPGSRLENKSGSRPGSPPKLHQSTVRGLSRRRSWLPSRSKPEPQGEVDGPGPWLIRPDEKLPYDASPLIHFQKVSTF